LIFARKQSTWEGYSPPYTPASYACIMLTQSVSEHALLYDTTKHHAYGDSDLNDAHD